MKLKKGRKRVELSKQNYAVTASRFHNPANYYQYNNFMVTISQIYYLRSLSSWQVILLFYSVTLKVSWCGFVGVELPWAPATLRIRCLSLVSNLRFTIATSHISNSQMPILFHILLSQKSIDRPHQWCFQCTAHTCMLHEGTNVGYY